MSNPEFEYFYGNETEQYIFFSVPQLLFTGEIFKYLSCESKLLYSFLLDRTGLSRKNGWYEEDGKIFVYFKQSELCERLNIGKEKAIKVFNELDAAKKGIGLIERKKQGQGKPTKIYVKNFAKLVSNTIETSTSNSEIFVAENLTSENPKSEKSPADVLTSENPKSEKSHTEVLTSENPKSEQNHTEVRNKTELQTSENPTSGIPECRSLKVGKSDLLPINHTNISILSESYQSNQSGSHREPKSEPKSESMSIDMIDRIDYTTKLTNIKNQIEYDALITEFEKSLIDEIAELIAWCMCTPQQVIRINGVDLDVGLVQNRFEKLDDMHIRYVAECISQNTTEIKNRRNYLLTCLYNAPVTIDGYYANKVQHDLYGS